MEKYWGIHPTSIIHVGAHLAEEHSEYKKFNWIGTESRRAIWVEAQTKLVETLKNTLDQEENIIYNYAIWSEDKKEISLNISNNTQSSSLFNLSKHKQIYPEIKFVQKIVVPTIRLDTLLGLDDLSPDFINLDIQGAELIALKSLGDKINDFKWIYSEVNYEELYEGCSLIVEIDEFLKEKNFKRVFTVKRAGAGWGDALYIREDLLGINRLISPRLIFLRIKNNYWFAKETSRIKLYPYLKTIPLIMRNIKGYFR